MTDDYLTDADTWEIAPGSVAWLRAREAHIGGTGMTVEMVGDVAAVAAAAAAADAENMIANRVFDALQQLIDEADDTYITFKGRAYSIADPALPVGAEKHLIALVRTKMREAAEVA